MTTPGTLAKMFPLPTGGGGTVDRMKVWDGADWVLGVLKVWDGASWVPGSPKVWDGGAWV